MNSIESFGTFFCVFLYRAMRRGNQHGGRKSDDLQNRLDMTSHENYLYAATSRTFSTWDKVE